MGNETHPVLVDNLDVCYLGIHYLMKISWYLAMEAHGCIAAKDQHSCFLSTHVLLIPLEDNFFAELFFPTHENLRNAVNMSI